MTKLKSSSLADSTIMDDATTTATKSRKRRRLTGEKEHTKCEDNGGDWHEKDEEEEEYDVELWEMLSRSFQQVQSVLDQNRVLIQQANDNHLSRIPDNLSENVALIRQISSNISNVLSIYSHLSADFSSIVHQRHAMIPAKNVGNDSGEGNRKLDLVNSGVESR